MNIEDCSGYSGEVSAYLFDGDLTNEQLANLDVTLAGRSPDFYVANLVTNIGRQQMTKLIVGETGPVLGWIGLTTSLTTPSLGLTALTDEIFRKAMSQRVSYLSYYQRYAAYYATTDFASTGIAGEGLFDTTSTGGSMWAVSSLTVSKSATQSLVLVHLIQATS